MHNPNSNSSSDSMDSQHPSEQPTSQSWNKEPGDDSEPGFDELPKFDPANSVDLIRQFQGGDAAALDKLLNRYQERIRRVVRIKLGTHLRNHLESMDIVQEVNMVAMRKLNGFEIRDEATVMNWLSTLVLNQIRRKNKYYKSKKNNEEGNVRIDAASDSTSRGRFEVGTDNSADMPDGQAWRNERREILDDCMSQLPEHYKDIVIKRDYYKMRHKDIAEELGISESNAQNKYERAKIKLRRLIRQRIDDPV